MIDKEYRRSLRQTEILIQLREKPVKSITELAERIGAQRPSASRSLHLLREQGFVERKSKGWYLTEVGKHETMKAIEEITETREKMKDITIRTGMILNRMDLSNDLIKGFNSLALPINTAMIFRDIFPSDIINAFGNVSSSIEMVRRITEDMQSFIPRINFSEIIGPITEVQHLNNSLIGNLTAAMHFSGIGEILKQNNIHFTNLINNIFTIRQTEIAGFTAQISSSIDFGWISNNLTNINRTYAHLFREHIQAFEFPQLPIISSSLTQNIIIPTETITYYTESLCDLIEAETETDLPPLSNQVSIELGDHSLDVLLGNLNPDFVEMRIGSWSALHSGSPDRLRQAATSQRELICQLLKFFVPDVELPEDQRGGPLVKARLRTVLGMSETDSDFTDAIVQAVFCFYNQLNKYTHQNKKHEESLRAILHTGEGLIRFIFAKKDENNSK